MFKYCFSILWRSIRGRYRSFHVNQFGNCHCCFVRSPHNLLCCEFYHRKITKLIIEKRKSRKLTVQSTSTEMATVEEMESPRPESRTENITRDNDEVFPYDVISTWTDSNGLYMSLRREGNDGELEDATQVARADYTNISPSNRNDSAANCVYAPLIHTAGLQGAREMKSPYVNADTIETSSNM